MKLILSITSVMVLLVVFTSGCKKDNSQDVNYTTLENAQKNAKTALTLSQSYNDTLIMIYDTAQMHKGNRFCLRYDSLYHHSDSMFSMHYKLFGDEMYRNGVMMPGYTSGGGMMGGGMMVGGMMDTSRWHQDTAMMNGYYSTMQHLHLNHQPYHNGIHN